MRSEFEARSSARFTIVSNLVNGHKIALTIKEVPAMGRLISNRQILRSQLNASILCDRSSCNLTRQWIPKACVPCVIKSTYSS